MSSGKRVIASKSATIASRSSGIEYTETKLPPPCEDFVTLFKNACGSHKDFSNRFTVDVLPNFIPILGYVIFHVSMYSKMLEATEHSKISAATFACYCMSLIYGYFLTCDLEIRPRPSIHAGPYDADTHRKMFQQFLMNMPVPDFLMPVLQYFTPTTDELRENIYFMPSAAGFTYKTHFGRIFPLSFFTCIQDCIAELPSVSPPSVVLGDLFTRPLYSFVSYGTAATPFTGYIGNFIGVGFPDHNVAARYNSKLEQIFYSMFNPVLFRNYHRRKNIASVSLQTMSYPNEFVNAYDFMFCSSPGNLAELRTVFTQISSSLSGVIKCPGDLASVFSTMSGSSILTHGYSDYALPTFFHSAIKTTGSASKPELVLKQVPPSDFSSLIRFLTSSRPTTTHARVQPSGQCTVDKAHKVTASFVSFFNRQSLHDVDDTHPDDMDELITFDEDIHIYPLAAVLNPTEPTTVDAWMPTAFGMIIESFEFDGSVVPHPNMNLANGIENSWFADSAVPYRYVYKASNHYVDTTVPFQARARAQPARQTRMPAASHLVDRTEIIVPMAAANTYTIPAAGFAFPGLTQGTLTMWLQKSLRFFGFFTADSRSHSDTSDQLPGVEDDSLPIWSPYSYSGYENDPYFVPDYSGNKIYFLTNLRTIYGTRVPVVEIQNAMNCMPVP